jgi:hypothetical protein
MSWRSASAGLALAAEAEFGSDELGDLGDPRAVVVV